MKIITIILTFLSPLAALSYDSIDTFKIAGTETKIYNYKSHQLSISEECADIKDGKLCKNLDFLNTISLKKSNLEGTTNMNPGSAICSNQLKGTVLIGIDNERNQNSFCKLDSGLLVDSGTLTYYARKNDGLVKPIKRSK